MPFGRRKPTTEELEEKNERLILEEEVAEKEVSIAGKKAMIKKLEREYGSGWRQTLGLRGKISISDLRHALMQMKGGLVGEEHALHNPHLSPLVRGRR